MQSISRKLTAPTARTGIISAPTSVQSAVSLTACLSVSLGNKVLLSALTGITALTLNAPFAYASELEAQSTGASEVVTPVYFGNGCFWGRQKEFVDVEKQLGRQSPSRVTSLVGYAGGKAAAGADGKVCYYYSDPKTVYERLGHAEVVQVQLEGSSGTEEQFRMFARQYFKQFNRTPFGMQRQDPQDTGAGYRNVVGIPGGTASPLFQILKDENVNKMELRAGVGNDYQRGKPTEDDLLNVVWVVDSESLPFYRAERYHQFHNGIGKAFPSEYTQVLKKGIAATGRIDPTGCPELPF